MLATDLVIAASDCRFEQMEVKRGIMANQGATIRITERVGSAMPCATC
jgi:enoyl-CoA hydratase